MKPSGIADCIAGRILVTSSLWTPLAAQAGYLPIQPGPTW
jgi:hypothetical protein